MPVSKHYELTHNGREVCSIFLRNANGMELKVTNYGGIVMALNYPLAQRSIDLVLGFDSPAGYLSEAYTGLEANPYLGALIGRFANRIASGRFTLDGKSYTLARNLFPEHLHGGTIGFNQKVWDIVSLTETPCPSVSLSYLSSDGEEGYPGNLLAEVTYRLNDNNEVHMEYAASTDAPTLYNPTNHTYFNLDGSNTNVKDHILRIAADNILEQDDHYTPTGNLLNVRNTMYDFREARAVGLQWDAATGYDQSFVVDVASTASKAEVHSPYSGISLEVFSTAPIVHFYTGAGLKNLTGKNDLKYEPFSGFTLETQIHPNGINLLNFPDAVLRPGEKFTSTTIYKFSLKQSPA